MVGHVQLLKKLRMQRRFAAAELHHIWFAFVGHHQIQHTFYFIQSAMPAMMRAAFGIAGGAGQVAPICQFNDGQAGVLFVVRAEATIVRASKMGVGVETLRHFTPFGIVARVAVVFDIGSDEYFFRAVLRTTFEHVNQLALKHNFSIHPTQAAAKEEKGKNEKNIKTRRGGRFEPTMP